MNPNRSGPRPDHAVRRWSPVLLAKSVEQRATVSPREGVATVATDLDEDSPPETNARVIRRGGRDKGLLDRRPTFRPPSDVDTTVRWQWISRTHSTRSSSTLPVRSSARLRGNESTSGSRRIRINQTRTFVSDFPPEPDQMVDNGSGKRQASPEVSGRTSASPRR